MQTLLNGQIATAEQLAEIEMIKADTDMQDGDLIITASGQNILDCAVFFSDDALMFMLHEYQRKNIFAECYDIDGLKDISSKDFENVATHYFNELSEVKQFIAEFYCKHNSVFAMNKA